MGCFPHAKKDWGKVFCCMPLGLVALFVSLLFCGWGGWEISTAVNASNFPKWESIIPLLIGILKALLGVCGILCLILRKAFLANLCATGYKVCISAFAAQFIVQWVFWILNMFGIQTSSGKEWVPNSNEIQQMVTFTVLNVIFFIISFWVLSTFRSLHMVLKSNGNGWEKKNYKDIKLDETLKNEQDDDYA